MVLPKFLICVFLFLFFKYMLVLILFVQLCQCQPQHCSLTKESFIMSSEVSISL